MIEQGMLWQAGRQAGRQDRSTLFYIFRLGVFRLWSGYHGRDAPFCVTKIYFNI